MGTLSEFSRPYAGEYVCTRLSWGARELPDAETLVLTLRQDGRFSLTRDGAEQAEGRYRVDAAGEHGTAIRIGVNAGSLEQDIAERDDLTLPQKLVASSLSAIV